MPLKTWNGDNKVAVGIVVSPLVAISPPLAETLCGIPASGAGGDS